MNVLNQKLNSQNQNSLQESLSRDINYALQNKPSLDALNNINNTIVDKPFLDQENLKLDISNNLMGRNDISELVKNQMGNLRNEVLQSNTVSQVIQMNYQNNNGNIIGNMEQLNIKSNDGKNFKVEHKKMRLPHPDDPIIKTFTISLNDLKKGDLWEKIEPPKPLLLNSNTKDEVYNGVKSVDVIEQKEEIPNKLERSFNDIMNNVKSNKILTFGFLVLVVVIIYLVRHRKFFGK